MLGYLLVAIALAISSLILVLVASGYGIKKEK
jgi:hypothetical protein